MAVLIDLNHARRARRLFNILLERYGIRHFLQGGADVHFKIDPKKLNEAVLMCADWISLRGDGDIPNDETLTWVRGDLRRILVQRIAESMVSAGY